MSKKTTTTPKENFRAIQRQKIQDVLDNLQKNIDHIEGVVLSVDFGYSKGVDSPRGHEGKTQGYTIAVDCAYQDDDSNTRVSIERTPRTFGMAHIVATRISAASRGLFG